MSSASAESYIRAAIAPSTRDTYAAPLRAFRQWRIDRRTPPDSPITAQEALSWLAELADRGLQANTLGVYRAALSTQWEEESHPDGERRNPLSSPLIRRFIDGVRNVQRGRTTRTPSAPLLFTTLLRFHFDCSLARDAMHLAAATLGVAAALRPSELLGSSRAPERALTIGQITFFSAIDVPVSPPEGEPTFFILRLLITKTQQRGGRSVTVSAPAAVAAMWRWIRDHRSSLPPSAPLFSLDGKPLSTFALTADLQRRHKAAGLGEVCYKGKCFRRGGAATVAVQGIAGADIASLGWAPGSQMWRTYASDPSVQQHRAVALNARMQVAPPLPPAATGRIPNRP